MSEKPVALQISEACFSKGQQVPYNAASQVLRHCPDDVFCIKQRNMLLSGNKKKEIKFKDSIMFNFFFSSSSIHLMKGNYLK